MSDERNIAFTDPKVNNGNAGVEPVKPTCLTCRFFDKNEGPGLAWLDYYFGRCRRYAPGRKGKSFPEVSVNSWCGQYEPATEH